MKRIVHELKKKLTDNIRKNPAQGLLLSGGLDSAILATLNSHLKTITVSLKSYGEDMKYADAVAKFLNLAHYPIRVDIEETMASIPEVIKILKTFDPALPNDLTVYFGLKRAKEMNLPAVMTGDGADELFVGYEFMKEIEDLNTYLERMSSSMHFSANELGKFLNITICQPYLENKFLEFALDISLEFKIREEHGKSWGKWILRKAFEDSLPEEIIWQNKRPLELGSGMTALREIIRLKISDEEFEEKKRLYPIHFFNKEHLYYYEIYRKVVGGIPEPRAGQKGCPGCGAGMAEKALHCKVCGYVWEKT